MYTKLSENRPFLLPYNLSLNTDAHLNITPSSPPASDLPQSEGPSLPLTFLFHAEFSAPTNQDILTTLQGLLMISNRVSSNSKDRFLGWSRWLEAEDAMWSLVRVMDLCLLGDGFLVTDRYAYRAVRFTYYLAFDHPS